MYIRYHRSMRCVIWHTLPPQDPRFCRCFSEALLPPRKLLGSDFLLCWRQRLNKCQTNNKTGILHLDLQSIYCIFRTIRNTGL